MNLISIHLTEDADVEAVEAHLLEIAAMPGAYVVVYSGSVLGDAELPAVPELENGE